MDKAETCEIVKADKAPVSAMSMLADATQRGCDVAAIEAIAKLYREERDDGRRMAFDSAMCKAQGEMKRVATDSANQQTHSRFASYAALDRVLRPIYTANGFGLSFNTEPTAASDMVRVTCRVSHCEGWTCSYALDVPSDGKGAKGGDVMTKTHAVGSATQYGMRYLLKMIFNVAIGTDDDGNAAHKRGPTIDEEQAANLRELCEACNPPRRVESLLGLAGVTRLEDYPLSAYNEAVKMLAKAANKKV